MKNPRIFRNPDNIESALDELDAIHECPELTILGYTSGFLKNVRETCKASKVQGGRIYDASIASICVQNHVTIFYSADRDFSRFPALKVKNPLIRK